MNTKNDPKSNLFQACKDGDIEKVKYYLTSPLIENKPNINDSIEIYKHNYYTPLMVAVSEKNMELTKYLLLSPDLKEHANINAVCVNSDPLEGACALSVATHAGSENMVQYLLCSPDLKEHAKVCPTTKTLDLIIINGKKDFKENEQISIAPLYGALCSGNTKIFDLLLFNSELKNNYQLVTDIIEKSLDSLFTNKFLDMLSHLLVNNYIMHTSILEPYIEKIDDRHFYNDFKHLFETVNTKNRLDFDLNSNSNVIKKSKI